MVANVNLPAVQLQVAMGVPLYRIKDIRMLYNQSPWGSSSLMLHFDKFCAQAKPKLSLILLCRDPRRKAMSLLRGSLLKIQMKVSMRRL
jgi:hypothetical protein